MKHTVFIAVDVVTDELSVAEIPEYVVSYFDNQCTEDREGPFYLEPGVVYHTVEDLQSDILDGNLIVHDGRSVPDD